MAIDYNNNQVTFEAVIYEDEVVPLRDYLQEKAPEKITFDFSASDDIHLAVIQLILGYKKIYDCDYVLGDEKHFHKVLTGFEISENHCN